MNVLRFAIGSDITPYFIGALDINGQRHMHSSNAIGALRPLVKWKLQSESEPEVKDSRRTMSSRRLSKETDSSTEGNHCKCLTGQVFRNAKIVGREVVSVGINTQDEKCVIKLSILMDRNEGMYILLGTPIPTSTFIFRHVDRDGNTFERPYTAAGCDACPVFRSSRVSHSTKLLAMISTRSSKKISLNNHASSNVSTAQLRGSLYDSEFPLHSIQSRKSMEAIIYVFIPVER